MREFIGCIEYEKAIFGVRVCAKDHQEARIIFSDPDYSHGSYLVSYGIKEPYKGIKATPANDHAIKACMTKEELMLDKAKMLVDRYNERKFNETFKKY